MKAAVVFGTRPDAIKMLPLALELRGRAGADVKIVNSGQHRDMVRPVLDAFGVSADFDLAVMKPGQTLTDITRSVLERFDALLETENFDLVLVHGDTSTAPAAALAAFHRKIPVGHVEAGLRTFDVHSPFPEEMNRLLTARLASVHFAPTAQNRLNLEKEGVSAPIFVTGNTVIDTFKYTVRENHRFRDERLNNLGADTRIILVTAHRRENIGEPLQDICAAVRQIAETFPDTDTVFPVHLNPAVREIVLPRLSGVRNVRLIEPPDLIDMHNLTARSYLVLTDSGGLQEEAPHFGVPALVLRTETERPEAVDAGTVKIAGTKTSGIVEVASALLTDTEEHARMARAVNPYGDGRASERIADIILTGKTKIPFAEGLI